jgi:histidine triad (HIT) family protein
VPHAHIHLVPMQNEKDINFSNPKLKLSEEEFKEITKKIKKEL